MTQTNQTADAARQAAETARTEASNVAGTAAGAVTDVARTAKEQTGQVVGEAAHQARDLAHEVKSQVSNQATEQTQKLAQGIRSLADELSGMAGSGDQDGFATGLVQQLVDKTRGLASYLEGRQPGELVDELRGFARRRPGTFLLGALALGVVAGRAARGATAGAAEQASGGPGMVDPYPTDSFTDTRSFREAGTGAFAGTSTGTGSFAGTGAGGYGDQETVSGGSAFGRTGATGATGSTGSTRSTGSTGSTGSAGTGAGFGSDNGIGMTGTAAGAPVGGTAGPAGQTGHGHSTLGDDFGTRTEGGGA